MKALRQLGAEVIVIEEPVDLLVGWRGHWVMIEIKNKHGLNRFTTAQKNFFQRDHKGPVFVCHSIEDCVRVLNEVVRQWKWNSSDTPMSA